MLSSCKQKSDIPEPTLEEAAQAFQKKYERNTDREDLSKAIAEGNIEKVKELIGKDQRYVNKADKKGYMPLYEACSAENVSKEILEYLLNQGAEPSVGKIDFDGKEDPSYNPIGSVLGYPELVKLLIEHGGDVNKGWPLNFVVAGGSMQTIKLLVDNGAEINGDCLMVAAAGCHTEIVRYLLSKNPDLTYKDENGQTILDYAYLGNESIDNSPEEERVKYKKEQKKIIKMLEAAGAKRGNVAE